MKILLVGATGAMGHAIAQVLQEKHNIMIVAGVGKIQQGKDKSTYDFPVYAEFQDIPQECVEEFDTVIDFSLAGVTKNMCKFLQGKAKNVVIATTGLDEETYRLIDEISVTNAVLQAGNMSYGVNLMVDIVGDMAGRLRDFEIQIIENHHTGKKDAPSGTAKMLFDSMKKVRNSLQAIFDRSVIYERPEPDEVYIASIRTGNVVGEHTVIFSKEDEILTITHKALSKKIFAEGAIKAAEFLADKQPGKYDIKEVVL